MSVSGDFSGGMYVISNLEPSTFYSIQVAAMNDDLIGPYSTALDQLTEVEAPVLTADTTTATTITISWSSAGSEDVSYVVMWERDITVGCSDEDEGSATINDDSMNYIITDLFGISDYIITVIASNPINTETSNEIRSTTTEAVPSAGPYNITFYNVIPDSFDIEWAMVPCIHRNGNITGYSVQYGVEGNDSRETLSINNTETFTTNFSGLTSDTRYVVEVAGVNNNGIGVYKTIIVTTPQTVYLNFGGENLPTNGYVTISQLGNLTDSALVCRTDQSGDGTGGWINPNGTLVEFNSNSSQGFYSSVGADGVYLLRGSGLPAEGIYTCRATDSMNNTKTVFVGLYNEDGGNLIVNEEIEFMLISEPLSEDLQFTLTCISTGGPATIVTWTRDSVDAVGDTNTELINATSAQYTHTLTVTGRQLGGLYTCTVSNNIPSENSTTVILNVATSPTDLMVKQDGLTSIDVSWTPPTPLGDTTGYIIYYTNDDNTDSVVIDGGSIDDYTLSDLKENTQYTISIVATSQHLPSEILMISLQLVLLPAKPVSGAKEEVTSNSITIYWQAPATDSVVVSYEVTWKSDGDNIEPVIISGDRTDYTITGLNEGSTYSITVTPINDAGRGESLTFTISTTSAAATSSSIIVISGAAGGGVAVVVVIILIILLCVCCRRRSSQKYNPRDLDGMMYKNASLSSSSYAGDTLQFIDKSSEPNEVNIIPSKSGEIEESVIIYGNLISPEIIQFPESMEVLEGEGVVFRVEVTGSPQPKMTWYHDGQEVKSDYSMELGDDGSLTMLSTETKHSGVYQLVVQNPAGRVEKKVTLTVQVQKEDQNMDGAAVVTQPPSTTALPVSVFGSHVEKCHLGQNQPFKDQYKELYSGDEKSTAIAINSENKTKNRFLNICVYDDHQVLLQPLGTHDDCQTDYINANYIDGYTQPAKFLATQGPLPKTVVDFWRLVWQEKAPTIVMITNLVEGTKTKCHQYWPDKDSVKFGPFEVSIIDTQILADYKIRSLVLQLTGSSEYPLRVTHFHFTAWPDHGVPDYATPLLTFHRRVITEHPPGKGPIIVHCSAGVGRTGTFIAIDHILEQVKKENKIDIPGVINKIRHQRMKLVQTVDQYIFIHDAILESVTCGDTQIVSRKLRDAIKGLEDEGFAHQFMVLDQVSPRPEEVIAGFAGKNPEKNRSTDFLPADKWRVTLRGDHPDYINAVYINGYKQQRAFIIAQSPMKSTARDFWKMVYDRKCGVIVMLCDLVENEKEVCYQYWPSSGTQTYGEFTVELVGEETMNGHVVKTITTTHSESGNTHQVNLFHITNWTSDGNCTNLSSVSGVVDDMTKVQRRTGNHPIIIHCSDTVSRSGMFCAIATTIERCKTEGVVDVFQVVKALRVQKPGAIQNMMQYKVIFQAVLAFLDSFDTYANF